MKKLYAFIFFAFILVCLTKSPLVAQSPAQEYYTLAQKNKQQGNYTLAIEYYTKALLEAPQFWKAYAERGYCKAHLKSYEEALIDYNIAVGMGAKDPLLYLNRGWAHYNLGLKADACSDWKEAQSLGYTQAGAIIRKKCP